MSSLSREELTELLQAWSDGDHAALARLTPLVYSELKRIAHRYLAAEYSAHTLESGGLVNEAYLRLIDWNNVRWQNRAHFFAVAAQMMRRILVDYARSKRSEKRGGEQRALPLLETFDVCKDSERDLVALDDALRVLEKLDARKSKVVELRFFGGLSVQETAAVLQVSEITVMRDWQFARSWLQRELTQAD